MIFVTGGTGLLGSYLLRDLVARGKKVSALYRSTIPSDDYAKSVEWIQGDILDTVLLEEAMQNVEQVYHCAAIVSFNPAKKYDLLKINAQGTANVVNAAIKTGIKKLVHVGSVSALGRSKYFAELEVWRGVSEGLNAVIINPSTILGVGNWNDGSAALFKKAWEEFAWYTDGSAGFVDAADVASIMIQIMESDITDEKFIVSAESIPFKTVFTKMAYAFGKKPPYKKAKAGMIQLLCLFEKWRCLLTKQEPLITKATAIAAQRQTLYDNSKLLAALPGFQYKPIQQTIDEYCIEYKNRQ